jgi:hypothetical protein
LAELINTVYGTDIKFNPVSVEAYEKIENPSWEILWEPSLPAFTKALVSEPMMFRPIMKKRLGGHTLLVWK